MSTHIKSRPAPAFHGADHDDWFIARRKGRMVRWQNRVTARMSSWEEDPFYEARKPKMPPVFTLDLKRMLKSELQTLADELGIKYAQRTTKRDLIAYILNA